MSTGARPLPRERRVGRGRTAGRAGGDPVFAPRAPRRAGPARGFGLLDALVALAILAFGLLAMTRLQARAVAQSTESNARSTAMAFADELLSSAIVDPANRLCYTLPVPVGCTNTVARAATQDWETRTEATLPGGVAAATLDAATGRLTVRITWTGKAASETRRLEATTDVRQ